MLQCGCLEEDWYRQCIKKINKQLDEEYGDVDDNDDFEVRNTLPQSLNLKF